MTGGADPLSALRARLAALPARLQGEVERALVAGGEAMVDEARRSLQGGGPGPSAPGTPPHDAAGALAAALSVRQEEGAVAIVATHPAARALEYGTRRMAARPFLRPAAEAARPAATALCRAALARAARSLEEGS